MHHITSHYMLQEWEIQSRAWHSLSLQPPAYAVVDEAWHHQRQDGHGGAVLGHQLGSAACSIGMKCETSDYAADRLMPAPPHRHTIGGLKLLGFRMHPPVAVSSTIESAPMWTVDSVQHRPTTSTTLDEMHNRDSSPACCCVDHDQVSPSVASCSHS
jgi:hypothetical protein